MAMTPRTLLVSTSELAAHIGDPGWVSVDCRATLTPPDNALAGFLEGHVPGARFLHLEQDLSGPKTGTNGRHPLPSPESFARRLGEVGVGPGTQVVVYDDGPASYASRLWWMLRWLGHDAVAVLDGGLAKWKSEGRALEQGPARASPARFVPAPRAWVATVEEVVGSLGREGTLVVDARGADRFRGENETLDPVGGHIPGARNRPFRENLAPNGTFKDPEQLRREWLALLGDTAADRVIHQCGSGVTACHNILALELAGLASPRLYAGSWSEWCADPSRPVAR
jgi:thiosulfate/3-mercaptopyruvate sulfurtransferase